MSEYKTLKGGKVKNYTTNPDNPYAGQVWFNETEGELRIQKAFLGTAWSSGGSLNTARRIAGDAGTQTAALCYGGYTGSNVGVTENYNGSSWTEVNDLNTTRRGLNVGGTSTSAIGAGGYTSTNVNNSETWNGSSWTETNNLNTARRELNGAADVNTAGLAFGGNPPSPGSPGITESWNGSIWTEVSDLVNARTEIGRSSCMERVYITLVAVTKKKK